MAIEAGVMGLRGDVERLQTHQFELMGEVTRIGRRMDWLLVAVLALGVGSMVLSFVVFVVVLARV